MFTGLIAATGRLTALERGNRPRLHVRTDLVGKTRIGGSVAVNGICLTVVEESPGEWVFNVSAETLRSTNLGDLPIGSELNLELPLTPQSFLDGHLVSGHVDGTARVRTIQPHAESSTYAFTFAKREWRRFLIPKGSVTVDGISLTVNQVSSSFFTVEIIPHTVAVTNLKHLRIGQRVNIELDLTGKYLYNFYLESKQ